MIFNFYCLIILYMQCDLVKFTLPPFPYLYHPPLFPPTTIRLAHLSTLIRKKFFPRVDSSDNGYREQETVGCSALNGTATSHPAYQHSSAMWRRQGGDCEKQGDTSLGQCLPNRPAPLTTTAHVNSQQLGPVYNTCTTSSQPNPQHA